tara:strand:- start:571 stop:1002 length:432 start_codon:yes stop_codon:yes gene_type:complete
MAIEWKPEMTVGNKTIDNQHKKLLGQINKLIKYLSFKAGLPSVRETIHFLEEYIDDHFSFEEKYVVDNNYPGLEKQKKLHAKFIEFFNDFKKEFNDFYQSGQNLTQKSNELASKAKEFLGDWYINHVLTEDREYYEYIKSHSK